MTYPHERLMLACIERYTDTRIRIAEQGESPQDVAHRKHAYDQMRKALTQLCELAEGASPTEVKPTPVRHMSEFAGRLTLMK